MNSSCPELTWTGDRFECGLVLHADDDEERRAIVESLGIGAGCPHAHSPKRIARARRFGIEEIEITP